MPSPQKSGTTTPERAQSNQRQPQVRERYVSTFSNNTQRRRKGQAAVTGVGIPKVQPHLIVGVLDKEPKAMKSIH